MGGGSSGEVSVLYDTVNQDAKSGMDYLRTSGTLVFEDGETRRTISVPIEPDSEVEGPEDFLIQLSEPGGGARLGNQCEMVVTIQDDETATQNVVQFLHSTYDVNEGDEQASIQVVLLGPEIQDTVTVHYNTTDATARNQHDYAVVSGTLTFQPGERRTQEFRVPILNEADGNAEIEGDETIDLLLSDLQGSNVELGTRREATLTIHDDDINPHGTMQMDKPVYNVSEQSGYARVQIGRIGGDEGDVEVQVCTADRTAQAGSDYTPYCEMLTFVEGEKSKTIAIEIVDDNEIEGDEVFDLFLSMSDIASGANLGSQNQTVLVIEDDDSEPGGTLQFSSLDYPVNENQPSIPISVYRTGGSVGNVSVEYNLFAGTATAHEGLPPGAWQPGICRR